MTAPQLWNDPAGPLNSFAQALGFDSLKSFNESPDEVTFHNESFGSDKLKLSSDAAVRAQQVAALDSVLREMKRKYGPTLTLTLKLAQDELNVHEEYTASDLGNFCDLVADSSFDLDLKINKKDLGAHWKIVADGVCFKPFLFPAALERALRVSLQELELSDNSVFRGFTGAQKLIILVPDHQSLELNGEYLTVLGGARVANWASYPPLPNRVKTLRKVQNIYTEAGRKLRWVNVPLDYLTPLHLKVDWIRPDGTDGDPPAKADPIAQLLFAHLLGLILLYTAHESRFPKPAAASRAQVPGAASIGPWIATFDADTYLARVEVEDISKVAGALGADEVEKPWHACLTMAGVAEWVYQEVSGLGNRIEVVQVALAGFLQDGSPSNNLSRLVLNASKIDERIKQRWENFLEEKLHRFFAHIKELETAVETTVNAYSEQVQALTKTLTDNMLAAVAVVVGSFLAAIFKSPFQSYVFLFGTIAYFGYLAVFPFLMGMLSGWQRFADSKAAFRKRRDDFSKRLTPEEVDDIVGQRVTNKEAQFKRWFNLTALSYTTILVLMVAAIIWVPGKIKQWTDNFKLTDVNYGAPVTGGLVPITIRGENFDKDKEIVVVVGHSKFTNTDGASLKVHGPTVLVLSPQRRDLLEAIEKNNGSIVVRQGDAVVKSITLPGSPPTSPDPTFARWTWSPLANGGTAEVIGTNFRSIAEVRLNGVKLEFQAANDGSKIELRKVGSLKDLQNGKIAITLIDGRELVTTVKIPS